MERTLYIAFVVVLVLYNIKRKFVSKEVKRRLERRLHLFRGFGTKKRGTRKRDKTHNTTHVLDISHGKDDAFAA